MAESDPTTTISGRKQDPGQWQPVVADPTNLTTEAVDRAKEDLRRELQASRLLFEERLAGLDRVVELMAETATASPEKLDALRQRLEDTIEKQVATVREHVLSELGRVRDVHDEKFVAVDTRFQERDERTAQAASESRVSLDAALAAAKEAVGEQNKSNTLAISKSELATQKQIDAMQTLMQAGFDGLDGKVADLKGRLDRGEGHESGGTDMRLALFGVIAFLLTAAAIISPHIGK